MITITAAAFSLLPALLLLTNGAGLLAMLPEYENSPASMLIPALTAVGWCLTVGAVVHGIACVTEIALAARRSRALLFAATVAMAGAVVTGVGAALFGQEIERINTMFGGANLDMVNAIRSARKGTALIASLAITVLLCHIPGVVYGVGLRRHHARALEARLSAEEAQFVALEQAERRRVAAQQPPSVGQLPYGALSQPYEPRT